MKTKGLFVVACLLAFNATAPAGLQLTVNGQIREGDYCCPPAQMMIGIWNDEGADQYNAALILRTGSMGEWTEESRLNRPRPLATGWERLGYWPDYGGDIWYAWFAQPTVDKLPAGIIGEVGFHFRCCSVATIQLVNDSFEPISSVTFFTPEPATIALLGLGAMMIRRKQSA
jgi:hypothetical protein